MKKTMKVVKILMIVIMLLITLSTVVNAGDEETVTSAGSIITGLEPDYTDDSGITTIGKKITSAISTIGVVVAVVVLLVLGIKYMIGSASEKAEYKKTMIPYLIGALLIFGASAIAKVVVNVSQSLTSTV